MINLPEENEGCLYWQESKNLINNFSPKLLASDKFVKKHLVVQFLVQRKR